MMAIWANKRIRSPRRVAVATATKLVGAGVRFGEYLCVNRANYCYVPSWDAECWTVHGPNRSHWPVQPVWPVILFPVRHSAN